MHSLAERNDFLTGYGEGFMPFWRQFGLTHFSLPIDFVCFLQQIADEFSQLSLMMIDFGQLLPLVEQGYY